MRHGRMLTKVTGGSNRRRTHFPTSYASILGPIAATPESIPAKDLSNNRVNINVYR